MTLHVATVAWHRGTQVFVDNAYSRAHVWRFDGGATVPASSSPHVVRVPLSNPAHVDPEEAFVAALSSCHMLWFLGIAAAKGYCVDSYTDEAQGLMARNAKGKEWVATVNLRPHVVFSGAKVPTEAVVAGMHHDAHEACYIANSVLSDIHLQHTWACEGAPHTPVASA